MRQSASRANAVRTGFILCRGAMGPPKSHHSEASAENLATSAAFIERPVAGSRMAVSALQKAQTSSHPRGCVASQGHVSLLDFRITLLLIYKESNTQVFTPPRISVPTLLL